MGELWQPITASIGVAHSPEGQVDLQTLQQRADSAMYQAKAAGRNRVTRLAWSGAWMDSAIRISERAPATRFGKPNGTAAKA